jgi:hypothetical protein
MNTRLQWDNNVRGSFSKRLRAGLAINDNGVRVIRTSLENEHGPLQSNQAFLWAVFNEEEEKVVLVFFRCSGPAFERLDRGVPVGIGLAIAL